MTVIRINGRFASPEKADAPPKAPPLETTRSVVNGRYASTRSPDVLAAEAAKKTETQRRALGDYLAAYAKKEARSAKFRSSRYGRYIPPASPDDRRRPSIGKEEYSVPMMPFPARNLRQAAADLIPWVKGYYELHEEIGEVADLTPKQHGDLLRERALAHLESGDTLGSLRSLIDGYLFARHAFGAGIAEGPYRPCVAAFQRVQMRGREAIARGDRVRARQLILAGTAICNEQRTIYLTQQVKLIRFARAEAYALLAAGELTQAEHVARYRDYWQWEGNRKVKLRWSPDGEDRVTFGRCGLYEDRDLAMEGNIAAIREIIEAQFVYPTPEEIDWRTYLHCWATDGPFDDGSNTGGVKPERIISKMIELRQREPGTFTDREKKEWIDSGLEAFRRRVFDVWIDSLDWPAPGLAISEKIVPPRAERDFNAQSVPPEKVVEPTDIEYVGFKDGVRCMSAVKFTGSRADAANEATVKAMKDLGYVVREMPRAGS